MPRRVIATVLALASLAQPAHAVPSRAIATVFLTNEPQMLDPLVDDLEATWDAATPILEGLTTVDDHGKVQPVLAERVPTVENGLVQFEKGRMVVTWPLRQGVKWHDGKAFSSQDVAFTFQALMDARTPVASREDYDQLERVVAVTPHRVRMTFRRPYAQYALLFPTVLPRHLLAGALAKAGPGLGAAAFNRHPVGTGPFKFSSWKPGERIELVANGDYWRGKPGLEGIRFVMGLSEDDLVGRNADVDLVQMKDPDGMGGFMHHRPDQVCLNPTQTLEFLAFNTERPPLDDVRVRQAIARALDRQALVQGPYQGLYTPAWSTQPPSSWAFVPAFRVAGPAPATLLEQAGWLAGRDGDRVREAVRLHLRLLTTPGDMREAAAAMVARQLAPLGIKVDVKIAPRAEVFGEPPDGLINGGHFDMAIFALASAPDPDDYGALHSSQVPPAGQNFWRFKHPELDRLLAAGRTTLAQVARRAVYAREQALLADQVPYVPLAYWPNMAVVREQLKNFKPNPTRAGNLWNCWEWRVER